MVSERPKCAKARHSPQGRVVPLPRTVTRHWRIWGAPFGQGEKRPSALLRALELATASPAPARLAADRFSPR